jgi:hypothetical protein
MDFFIHKVMTVSASTDEQPADDDERSVTSARLSSLQSCTAADVRNVIISPTKSCSLDPIGQTFLLKETVDALLPFLTALINASLRDGLLPASQKHAIITPLLKKTSLDPDELKNYRPVSNLTFISKVVERIFAQQLVDYLQRNDLMPHLQSANRRHHSTETALLRVLSDLFSAADGRYVSLLGLLDLSAAFDCVDHNILLRRLRQSFGIDGTALAWISSFLADRTQRVGYHGRLSAIRRLVFGVPQGSVLGPLLFLLYTAAVFDIIAASGLQGHCYADDTQVYLSAPAEDADATVQRFVGCVEKIDLWMSRNRLKLNPDKTQVIWIGTRQQLAGVNIRQLTLSHTVINFSPIAADLGVIVDSRLNMATHVSSVCRSCHFQLRQLRQVRGSLTTAALQTLVHAFISSRLDYCNSLLSGIADGLLRQLQSVQNAAARLVTATRKFDHIKPVLRGLHWLPVRQRVTFKIALLVYKCLHGLAPSYLAEFCQPVSGIAGRQRLRSAVSGTLFVPRTRTVFGARSFAVQGPAVWNGLPADLRSPDLSTAIFTDRLKTHLFNCV